MRYSPKQIERYKRQKYINHLEKIGKNLFKMFRNKGVKAERFLLNFSKYMITLESLERDNIRLDSEYLKESKSYYKKLYLEISNSKFDDEVLDSIRQEQMSNLNRLQKLKNSSSYKKDKHKKLINISNIE